MPQEENYYLTKKGLRDIEKEYEVLRNLRSAKAKGEVPKIWESEDLNPEYLSFQEDLGILESRIAELENILKNTKLIKIPSKKNQDIVKLGARVLVEIDKKDKDEFEIVGTLEVSPSLGKISDKSPVGKALLGSKIGEKVIVSSPIKTVYEIKRIRYRQL